MAHLKKSGTPVTVIPRSKTSTLLSGYEEVIIPLSDIEKRNARTGTTCHVQVVKKSNIVE